MVHSPILYTHFSYDSYNILLLYNNVSSIAYTKKQATQFMVVSEYGGYLFCKKKDAPVK